MAKISVNNQFIVNGILTVRRFKDEEGIIRIEGSFACHYYFEEINSLTSYRYAVTGIDVVEEIFEADNFDIIYNFTAEAIDNKCDATNLTIEEIENIEKGIYGRDGYVLGTILEKGVLLDDE